MNVPDQSLIDHSSVLFYFYLLSCIVHIYAVLLQLNMQFFKKSFLKMLKNKIFLENTFILSQVCFFFYLIDFCPAFVFSQLQLMQHRNVQFFAIQIEHYGHHISQLQGIYFPIWSRNWHISQTLPGQGSKFSGVLWNVCFLNC